MHRPLADEQVSSVKLAAPGHSVRKPAQACRPLPDAAGGRLHPRAVCLQPATLDNCLLQLAISQLHSIIGAGSLESLEIALRSAFLSEGTPFWRYPALADAAAMLDAPADEVEEKYGKISSIVAPRPVPGDMRADPPGVGLIFVLFEQLEAAVQGQRRLNGRLFGASATDAKFYDEKAFARQRFQ